MESIHNFVRAVDLHQSNRVRRNPLPAEEFRIQVRDQYGQDGTEPEAKAPSKLPGLRSKQKFALGSLCVSPQAVGPIPLREILTALHKHAAGDWGVLGAEEVAANQYALGTGGPVCSLHVTRNGKKLWIATDPHRKATTVLLAATAF